MDKDVVLNKSYAFIKKYKDVQEEKQYAQRFIIDFFDIFGIDKSDIKIEYKTSTGGYIDGFKERILLIEMKSRGKDLDEAYKQAQEYMLYIEEYERPEHILICDFHNFHIYNIQENTVIKFTLDGFIDNIESFNFIIHKQERHREEQNNINIEAVERIGRLHDMLYESNYRGHKLQVFLVRVLFCLFADDTGIFEIGHFKRYIESTRSDGSDIGMYINNLFQVLNTDYNKRQTSLDDVLQSFPYINGSLFEEIIEIPSFNKAMKEILLESCNFDWSKISPAIFGSLFQSVMDKKKRKELGAHYTSEENIKKLIKPLFLDALWDEYYSNQNDNNKLSRLHNKLKTLTFLDPACGCGNFLIVTYYELRKLEMTILSKIYRQGHLDIAEDIFINVNQFYGIEYEEFPAQIARTALWLTDHQINREFSSLIGARFIRIPLLTKPNIIHSDALEIDWKEIVQPSDTLYILGNPPFVGAKKQTSEQRLQVEKICGSKILDYVCCWYVKAAEFMYGTHMKAAFVSTNSITQGEQVSVLHSALERYNTSIFFAYKDFKWSNEASHNAQVSCIIIGFSTYNIPSKKLYTTDIDYTTPSHISLYLTPYDTIIYKRQTPLCKEAMPMRFGNMPLDGGYLLFTDDEKNEFVRNDARTIPFIKPLISNDEYMKGHKRWCLWITEPHKVYNIPSIMERISNVRAFRNKSSSTKLANTPYSFRDTHTHDTYLLIPSTNTNNLKYKPMTVFGKDDIPNNSVHVIPRVNYYLYGLLQSRAHHMWLDYVGGSLGTNARYSKDIVYNTYPFPKDIKDTHKQAIIDAIQYVISVREQYKDTSLSSLYHKNTMPKDLQDAHKKLDNAVYKAYNTSEEKCLERLLELYKEYNESSLLSIKRKK